MRPARHLAILVTPLFAASVLGQGQKDPVEPAPPIPAQVVIDDLRLAYSKPAADEVTFRFRSPAGERSDTYIVRIEPGPPGSGPKRVLLELGTVRAYMEPGRLIVVSTAVGDKVYIREFTGPVTPVRLGDLLPPLPVPQLALVAPGDAGLASPLCHLNGIDWSPAVPDEGGRPPTVAMHGAGPTGTIDVVSLLPTGRLHRIAATVRRGESEAVYDMSFRAIEPGDPATWAPAVQERQRVNSLTELRPSPRPLNPVAPGEAVPNISLSRFNMTGWSLYQAQLSGTPRPLALLLFRLPEDGARAQAALQEARAAAALLRSLRAGPPGESAIPEFVSAAAIVIELGAGARERWAEVRRTWLATVEGADEPMWSSAGADSIERFIPGATGVIVIVRPDRTLGASIRLDGRPASEVAAEVRKALAP